ncbi:hypothetical protein BO86DRAFT_340745 [Aspergillus japonicus CBS 114.51]|uniref:C3H1-type domain-containing protein n=1 Tax=Aspergillus japonicus CBS 114.51 TaxID=1448312 RepID=A0A8T8WY56_ASPJA|nr:hypothetical protein BO86DRAFT_340745 [Aspergillus japonicus CBS 114.51]RAH80827.1 hypothetical protein BO86DRAFT_340745 [Aspergillus japonicus CBS 114.51]
MAGGPVQKLTASVSEGESIILKIFEELKTQSGEIANLDQEYRDVSNDLSRERSSARRMQEELEALENFNRSLLKAIDDSSFVLVLIDADADGYIFKDKYYTDSNGGRQAALDLEEVVREYLKKCYPNFEKLPIMIKAFANLDGLSQFLSKAKLIKSPMALTTFAKGFSQASHISDFVLVGSGKDRADEKIRGIFQEFIGNPTCRHVMFGACHDNGYVRLLEKYQNNNKADSRKVTLIYPFEPGKEFGGLSGYPSLQFETIFQTESVMTRNLSPPPPPLPQTHRALGAEGGSPPPSLAVKNPWMTVSAKLPQYAISRKSENLPEGSIYVNAAGQRVDSELPHPSQEAQGTWHRKMSAKMKFCRRYHLHPYGCKGDCGYSHGPLMEDEKLIYRRKLRLENCHTGPQCRDAGCLFGHHCSCEEKACKFLPEMHHIDTSSVRVMPCI